MKVLKIIFLFILTAILILTSSIASLTAFQTLPDPNDFFIKVLRSGMNHTDTFSDRCSERYKFKNNLNIFTAGPELDDPTTNNNLFETLKNDINCEFKNESIFKDSNCSVVSKNFTTVYEDMVISPLKLYFRHIKNCKTKANKMTCRPLGDYTIRARFVDRDWIYIEYFCKCDKKRTKKFCKTTDGLNRTTLKLIKMIIYASIGKFADSNINLVFDNLCDSFNLYDELFIRIDKCQKISNQTDYASPKNTETQTDAYNQTTKLFQITDLNQKISISQTTEGANTAETYQSTLETLETEILNSTERVQTAGTYQSTQMYTQTDNVLQNDTFTEETYISYE